MPKKVTAAEREQRAGEIARQFLRCLLEEEAPTPESAGHVTAHYLGRERKSWQPGSMDHLSVTALATLANRIARDFSDQPIGEAFQRAVVQKSFSAANVPADEFPQISRVLASEGHTELAAFLARGLRRT